MPRTTTDQALITGLVVRGESRAGEPHPGVAPVGCAAAHRRSRPGAARRATVEPRRARGRRRRDRGRARRATRVLAATPTSGCPRAGARTGGFVLAVTGRRRPDHRRLAGGARSSGAAAVTRRSSSSFPRRPVSRSAASCSGGGAPRADDATRRRRRALGRQVAGDEPRGRRRHGRDLRGRAQARRSASRAPRAACLPGQRSRCGARSVTSCRSRRSRAGTRFAMQRGFGMIETREEVGGAVVRPAAAAFRPERQPRQRGSVRHAVEAGPALRLERASAPR